MQNVPEANFRHVLHILGVRLSPVNRSEWYMRRFITTKSIDGVSMSRLTDFRAEKDHFFATHPQSPLHLDNKRDFEGLVYFPENESLRLEVEIHEFPNKEDIKIQTTTGEMRTYQRFGRIYFQVDGEDASLTIYNTDFGFFLPFVDSLANTETYGAGRYLEPDQLSNGKFLVDFNLAYNPYCAYNEQYSCPLTPFENRLKVPIRAGEKIFKTKS
jgi:uncharacterized protein (DUF1684 family)